MNHKVEINPWINCELPLPPNVQFWPLGLATKRTQVLILTLPVLFLTLFLFISPFLAYALKNIIYDEKSALILCGLSGLTFIVTLSFLIKTIKAKRDLNQGKWRIGVFVSSKYFAYHTNKVSLTVALNSLIKITLTKIGAGKSTLIVPQVIYKDSLGVKEVLLIEINCRHNYNFIYWLQSTPAHSAIRI